MNLPTRIEDQIWALTQGALALLRADAYRGNGPFGAGGRNNGAIAVLPLWNILLPRRDYLCALMGATPLTEWVQMFREAVADSYIKAIVIDCDSPGGTVTGVDELSAEIFRARGRKPLVAQVNSLMASAAYWICSACDEVVMTPSGQVGSIGVYAAHTDVSKQDEMSGQKITLISAGRYKVEADPSKKLSDEARAYIQHMVDEYYDLFLKAVARNRGVKTDDVQKRYGQGRLLMAEEALKAGAIDRVGTLTETVARFTKKEGSIRKEVRNPWNAKRKPVAEPE